MYSTHCIQFVVFIELFRNLDMSYNQNKEKSRKLCLLLGKRIRQLRNDKKLSVAEVAYKADIDSQNLRKYELGKQEMKISMLFRIANALEVTPQEILIF